MLGEKKVTSAGRRVHLLRAYRTYRHLRKAARVPCPASGVRKRACALKAAAGTANGVKLHGGVFAVGGLTKNAFGQCSCLIRTMQLRCSSAALAMDSPSFFSMLLADQKGDQKGNQVDRNVQLEKLDAVVMTTMSLHVKRKKNTFPQATVQGDKSV